MIWEFVILAVVSYAGIWAAVILIGRYLLRPQTQFSVDDVEKQKPPYLICNWRSSFAVANSPPRPTTTELCCFGDTTIPSSGPTLPREVFSGRNKSDTCLVVEACFNGVLCLSDFDPISNSSAVYLWNPATKEVKKLPSPAIDFAGRYSAFRLGLCSGNDGDLKVVRVWRRPEEAAEKHNPLLNLFMRGTRASVYSLRTNSWRLLGAPLSVFDGDDQITVTVPNYRSSVLVNRRPHWSFVYAKPDHKRIERHHLGIVSFDPHTEAFALIRAPEEIAPLTVNAVGKSFGCLSLVCTPPDLKAFHVWVFKGDEWAKHATVLLDFCGLHFLSPYSLTDGGYVLLTKDRGSVWYNLNTMTVQSFCNYSSVGDLVAEYVPSNYRLT